MKKQKKETDIDADLPGYPHYPEDEDIFEQETRVTDEKVGQDSTPADSEAIDLDVPGSELDDDQERLGSEDEENNYYSLGGDNHD